MYLVLSKGRNIQYMAEIEHLQIVGDRSVDLGSVINHTIIPILYRFIWIVFYRSV